MIKPRQKKRAGAKPPAAARAPFSWRRVSGGFLITNDFGHHALLGPAAFQSFAAGKNIQKGPLDKDLAAKGFFGDRLDLDGLTARLRGRAAHLFAGPSLHIMVLTTRCNQTCVYCQAGASRGAAGAGDMSWNTARKCVDFAFQSPAPSITLEFQGGEPLLNWGVLEKAAGYARRKAAAAGRKLSVGVVSNFSLMTAQKADFLLDNEVSVCTSLDGPASLHDRNRPFSGGSSHAAVVRWLEYFSDRAASRSRGARYFKPSALLTVTRRSLAAPEAIADEYVRRGVGDIFIRPLTPIGAAKKAWGEVGYSAAEFVSFYSRALDHILALNRRGTPLREKLATILLSKVLGSADPGYVDLRCPCGAAVGQLAYAVNGDVYTCDEGRMLAAEGDDLFRLGSVLRDGYKKVVAAPAARACAAASELHSQPECSRCAYAPYCGVCPAYNYSVQGSLWGSMPSNDRCALMKGLLDALFKRLARPADREILEKWAEK